MKYTLETQPENTDTALINKALEHLSQKAFQEALEALKNTLSQSTIPKLQSIPIYIVSYDKESKTHHERAKQLMKALRSFLGEKNVLCDAIGMDFGSSRSEYVGRIEKCHHVIVLATRALKEAYDEHKANVLSNVVLSMVFTKLVENKSKIIPFYLEGASEDEGVPFFLKDNKAHPIRDEMEYRQSFFPLLHLIFTQQHAVIDEVEKQFQQSLGRFTHFPLLELAKKWEQESIEEKKREQQASFEEISQMLFDKKKVGSPQPSQPIAANEKSIMEPAPTSVNKQFGFTPSPKATTFTYGEQSLFSKKPQEIHRAREESQLPDGDLPDEESSSMDIN